MTAMEHREKAQGKNRERSIDPISLAVLIVALFSLGFILFGVLARGTTPWVILAPLSLGAFALLTIKK